MKKLNAALFLISLLTINGLSQLSMTDGDSAIWRFAVEISPNPDWYEYYELDYLMKDTVLLDDISYRKLFIKDEGSVGDGHFIGLLRSDSTEKVWFKADLDYLEINGGLLSFPYTDQEILLYDFGMALGDSMNTSGNQSNYTYHVFEMYSSDFTGIERDVYNLQITWEQLPWDGGDLDIWIEGIGSTYNFLTLFFSPGMSASTFPLCYSNYNADSTYTYLFAEWCSQPDYVFEKESQKLILWPNPGSNVLNIQIEHTSLFRSGSLKIYNLQGQCVKTIEHNLLSDASSLDINDLTPGLYTLRITNEVGRSLNKEFVVIR